MDLFPRLDVSHGYTDWLLCWNDMSGWLEPVGGVSLKDPWVFARCRFQFLMLDEVEIIRANSFVHILTICRMALVLVDRCCSRAEEKQPLFVWPIFVDPFVWQSSYQRQSIFVWFKNLMNYFQFDNLPGSGDSGDARSVFRRNIVRFCWRQLWLRFQHTAFIEDAHRHIAKRPIRHQYGILDLPWNAQQWIKNNSDQSTVNLHD